MKRDLSLPADLPETAMRKIVEKWSPSTLGLFVTLKGLETLVRFGVGPKEDPWRKWTRAFCSGELCKFSLAAFRLNACSDLEPTARTRCSCDSRQLGEHTVSRLASFLRARRGLLRRRVLWGRRGVRIVDNPFVDIVAAEFDGNHHLKRITPHFENPPPSVEDTEALNGRIVAAYNATQDVNDKRRPLALSKMLCATVPKSKQQRGESAYVERVLSSVFVHFTESRLEDRLVVPNFSERKHPGFGVFNVLGRLYPNETEVDLWFQSNHVLVDGKPVLELINELKTSWGTAGRVVVPTPSRTSWTVAPIPARATCREVTGLHRFFCFEDLLSSRKELNRQYSHLVGKVTLASMITWGLAQSPALRQVKVMTVVDLRPRPGFREERSLSFIGARPARFLDEEDRKRSFLRFQADFNQQLRSARERSSAVYRAMEAQALLPVWAYRGSNAVMPRAVDDLSGTVVLTIKKDADFCVAPIDDRVEAVISVGNALMPTQNGGTAGVVSIMTGKGKEDVFRKAVTNAIRCWRL